MFGAMREKLENIKEFTTARDLNSKVFGNIFKRKRSVMARFEGFQKNQALFYSYSMNALEKSLLQEYNEILQQEELYWFQKSRVQWLQLGDKCTGFFHATIL